MQKEQKNESMLSYDFIAALSKGRGEDAWLLEERKKAFKHFESLDVPTLKYGLGVQTNLNHLDLTTVDPSVDVEVILEGDAQESGIVVTDLASALKTHGDLLRKYMFTTVPTISSKFTALATAFLNSGTLVYIPKDTEVKTPIVIESRIQDGSLFDYLLVIAENNSKVVLYDIVSQLQKEGLRSGIVEIVALEGAKVDYVGIQKLNKRAYQFVEKCSHAHKDAEVNWFDCQLGSKLSVVNLASKLVGTGSRTNNIGLFFGDDNQHFDLNISSQHLAPNTTSDMFSRGVLTEKSRLIFNGLVKIAKEGSNSNGFQTQNTLLLSDQARADATPMLEIDNNDVKCSHATTLGKVDDDQLFYLMSRGLTKEDAKQKIVEGFFVPLFQKANIVDLQQRLEKELARVRHV